MCVLHVCVCVCMCVCACVLHVCVCVCVCVCINLPIFHRVSFGTTKYCTFFLRGIQCSKPVSVIHVHVSRVIEMAIHT